MIDKNKLSELLSRPGYLHFEWVRNNTIKSSELDIKLLKMENLEVSTLILSWKNFKAGQQILFSSFIYNCEEHSYAGFIVLKNLGRSFSRILEEMKVNIFIAAYTQISLLQIPGMFSMMNMQLYICTIKRNILRI